MNPLKNDTTRKVALNLGLPILAPAIIAVATTVISFRSFSERTDARVSYLEAQVLDKQLPTRIANLEVQIEKHEKTIERDFGRHEQTVQNLSHKTDDQEKRLTRLETIVGETQKVLDEIRTDVKILLRGGMQ